MKIKHSLILATLLLPITPAAVFAQHSVVLEPPEVVEKYVYARVIKVSPVYHHVATSTPVKECWDEPVGRSHYRGGHSVGSTLAGGLLGGVIGHQIGDGSGQKLSTALGTIIGAQLGHDASGYDDYSGDVYYRNVCQVTEKEDGFEVIQDGYQVSYLYKGKKHNIHMPYHPGDQVKLKVQVNR